MSELIIKKTAKHSAGTKYLAMAADGPIPAPVEVKTNPAGKLEAFIDDEPIGFLKMDADDLPEVYEIHIKGVSPDDANAFIAELTTGDGKKKTSKTSDIEALKTVIGNLGILSNEEIDRRILAMTDNNVDNMVIEVALQRYREYPNAVMHIPSALYRNMRTDAEESILQQALMCALAGKALIFVGDKSTGKNVCAETIAFVLGRPYYRVSFQKDMLPEDIFGTKTTDNSAAEMMKPEHARAKIKVELSPEKATEEDIENAAMFDYLSAQSASIRLVQSVSDIIKWAKEGGIILFDEVNMANPNLLQSIMNSAADGEKTLIVPGVGNIKLNPDCVLIAGMNPSTYAGTCELNDATESRCGIIKFEYPKSIMETLMANFSEDTCLKKKQFKMCDDLYKDILVAYEHDRISDKPLNIRGFVNALGVVEMFPTVTSLANQIEIFVINRCNEDEQAVLLPMLRDKIAV